MKVAIASEGWTELVCNMDISHGNLSSLEVKRSSTVEQQILLISDMELAVYKDKVVLTHVPVFNILFSDQKVMTT